MNVKVDEIPRTMHPNVLEPQTTGTIGSHNVDDLVRPSARSPQECGASMTGHRPVTDRGHRGGNAGDRVEFTTRKNRDTRVHLAHQSGITGGAPSLHRVPLRHEVIAHEDHVRATRQTVEGFSRDSWHAIKWELPTISR
jgi:hypothetical protein